MPKGKGLAGLIGQGVGLASEYKQHRQQQKLLREQSQQSQSDNDGGASASTSRSQGLNPSGSSCPSGAPPRYSAADEARHGAPDNKTSPPYRDGRDEKSSSAHRPSREYEESNSEDEDDDEYDDEDENDEDDNHILAADEADWELDEAFHDPTDEPPSYASSQDSAASESRLVREVMATGAASRLPNANFQHIPLPCPVILPQRRPGSRQRGFVRAYAPLLGECCDINQETFLAFLKNFQKSTQAHPIFGILIIGAAGAGLAPGPIAMAVSSAVQLGAQVGATLDSHHKHNTFLDKINRELFMPHGVYAMIMKYKPDAQLDAQQSNSPLARFGIESGTVDMSTTSAIAKSMGKNPANQTLSDHMRKFKLGTDTTRGSAAMPEAAPLIFPDVEQVLTTEGPENFKDKMKDAKKFLAGYMDRRKQMQYAADNPNDALAIPGAQGGGFKSKYSDPNHPMYSGGLLSIASGGALSKGGMGGGMGGGRNGGSRDRRRDRSYQDGGGYGGGGGGGRRNRRNGGGVGIGGGPGYDDYEDGYGPGPSQFNDGTYGGGPQYGGGPYGRQSRRDNGRRERRSRNDGGGRRQGRRSQFDDGSYAGGPRYGDPIRGSPGYDDPGNGYRGGPGGAPNYDPRMQQGQMGGGRRNGRRQDGGRQGGGRQGGGRQKGGSGVKRLLKEDVLYLTIVNMPSERELAEARSALGIASR